MQSGWDVYYVVFLSAALALLVPAALGAISSFLRPPRAAKEESMLNMDVATGVVAAEPAKEFQLGRRINTRFFLGATLSIALIAFGLLLAPCVSALHPEAESGLALRALVGVYSLVVLASLGLLYSVRKGDLQWLTSYRSEKGDPK